jgi:hypothetical protein
MALPEARQPSEGLKDTSIHMSWEPPRESR